MESISDDVQSEFDNIRNQIVQQFFVEYDPQKLAIILNTLGCQTIDDCPTLIRISSIDFIIRHVDFVKLYIERGEKQKKNVIHSVNVTIWNNSTSQQEVNTPHQDLKVTQNFQVNIRKTDNIAAPDVIMSIYFTGNEILTFNFTKNEMESANRTQIKVVNALPQKVVLDACTKMNVTYNFYEYEEFNYYLLDFEIYDGLSTINHPDVDANSNVIFVKSNLINFLKTHVEFVQNLKFKNSIVIRLYSAGNDRFFLQNFPTTETIKNFGVDIVYGEPEGINTPVAVPLKN